MQKIFIKLHAYTNAFNSDYSAVIMILLACRPVGIEIWLLKKCNTKLINYECTIIASATAL